MPNTLSVYASATPRDLCYAIDEIARSKVQAPWTSRPYNYREADRTTWWLIPSTEWPAYSFGKYGFWWDPSEPGVFFVGFEIEKGVEPAVSNVFRSPAAKRFITQEDWEWNRFAKAVKEDTEFDEAIDHAAAGLKSDILIHLSIGIANDPESFDPDAPSFPRATRLFQWKPGQHSIDLVQSRGANHLVPEAAKAVSLRDLLGKLAAAPEWNWLWVSLHAGVRLKPTSGLGVLNPHDLWTNCLRFFTGWTNP